MHVGVGKIFVPSRTVVSTNIAMICIDIMFAFMEYDIHILIDEHLHVSLLRRLFFHPTSTFPRHWREDLESSIYKPRFYVGSTRGRTVRLSCFYFWIARWRHILLGVAKPDISNFKNMLALTKPTRD